MNGSPVNGKTQGGEVVYAPETRFAASAVAPAVDLALATLLSPSQVNTYLECPTRWYFKYLADLPDPAGSALAVGKAVDNSLSYYFRAKAEGIEVPPSDVLDAVDTAWADEEVITQFFDNENADELHQLCRRLVESYLTQMAPKIQPALIDGVPAVQLPVSGEIADVKVRGYIDILTADGTVIDFKTKRDKPYGITADHMLQVTTYSMLCPHSRGKAELHYMVKGRSTTAPTKNVPFTLDIGSAEVQYAESVYPAVQEAMRDGLYLPNRNARLCSRRLCPFWKACEKEFGGHVK